MMRPLTLPEFRDRVDLLLQRFEGEWLALQSSQSDALPRALPFEEWWLDFIEAVDSEAVADRPTP